MKHWLSLIKFIIWLFFIIFLLLVVEIFARYKLKYDLFSFTLTKNNFIELDKLKIYNKKFVDEHKSNFADWPISLDTFESSESSPMYIFKPNLKMTSKKEILVPTNNDHEINWSSNSWGFRGKEFSVKKPKEIIRIIALGASTTEGSQADNQTYPYYLEEILKSKGYKVEVINAGHHAHNISDTTALFRQKVLPLKPDVVIFYEAANSMNPGEYLNGWKGWYSWDAGYGSFFKLMHQRSAIFVFITKLLGYEKRQPPITNFYFLKDSPKLALRNYKDKVTEMARLSKQNNTHFILATFVTVANSNLSFNSEEKPNLWEDLYLKWYPFNAEQIGIIYDNFNQGLKEIAQAEKIDLVDLASEFPKNPNYFIDHIHFTPSGNQVLAKLLADYFEKNYLLKKLF